ALEQMGLRATQIDDQIQTLGALDDDGNQFTDAAVVLVENSVALGFAHLLQDDLFGGLRSDAAEHVCRLIGQNFRADFCCRVLAASLGNADFASGIGNFFDHGQN